MNFYGSSICTEADLCGVCRNNSAWRAGVVPLFDDLTAVDFPCPYNGDPPKKTIAEVPAWLRDIGLDELLVRVAKYPLDTTMTRLVDYLQSDKLAAVECPSCARRSAEGRLRLWLLNAGEAEHGS